MSKHDKNKMTKNMSDLSSSPIKLPEELQKLLNETQNVEFNCPECYNSPPIWEQYQKENFPEILKKEMKAMDKEVERDPREKVEEQLEKQYELYEEELEEQHVERLHQQIVRDNANGFWKYEEDETLKELQDYLSGTYRSHYTSQESKTQTLDLIESIGDAEPFCRSNAIKYLSRFGKKNGKSKLDILKAMHYCVLLYHFAGLHKKSTDNYETF